jgi:hypothetical protein
MQNNECAVDDFRIPDYVRHLFGDPPILKTEDEGLYYSCMQQAANSVKPIDIIEWLWLKDAVDLSWEILRLRRLKIDVVEIKREDKNATIEWERDHADEPHEDWDGKLMPRDPDDIEARKNRPLLDTYWDSCDFLVSNMALYERIESLLTSAELRRDRILREIELRRDHMGRRLRAASNEMLNAQVSDVQITGPRIAAE